MMNTFEPLITKVYEAFNGGEINTITVLMHPEIHWEDTLGDGFIEGHDNLKEYWLKQWASFDIHMQPQTLTQSADGRTVVTLSQRIKDLQGNVLSENLVKHSYFISDGLLCEMQIVKNV